MKNDIDIQFLCKDCERYNACEYYHDRKKDSYICKNFHLTEDKPIMRYEELWDRLYKGLNGMKLAIAPDETVTDADKRKYRYAQIDLIDEIMEWMIDQVSKAK